MLDLGGGSTVAEARRALSRAFAAGHFDTPELDARLIVGHTLGLDHAALASASARRLEPAEAEAIAALGVRRLGREPVARILGRKEFWGLPLTLNAETLVPRPETETVVEAALDAVDAGSGRAAALRIADLGTGTGAIILALLSELPAARGFGTDLSVAALRCAHDNARNLGFGARAHFAACDFGTALAGPFDLVVSNPPYLARDAIATLPPEVRGFDPIRALDGGPDGLDGYRAVAADARRLLAPHGRAVVELGFDQHGPVMTLFAMAGLVPAAAARLDLAGVTRALVVKAMP